MGNCACLGESVQVGPRTRDFGGIDINSLVLPERQFFFPLQARPGPGREDGECLLFLESAHNVPCPDPLRDLTCQAASSRSHGRPYVRAWAEREDGALLGRVAKWPAKSSNAAPLWFSAQSLGFPLGEHSAAKLRLELWDDRTLLASLGAPLGELPMHCVVTRELERLVQAGSSKPSAISFQVLNLRELMDQRTVFFVRHGESVWNKAQDSLQLHEMARTTDHPLSAKGRKQAEALAAHLARAAREHNAALEQLLRPDAVYVSPLTRAVQTAVIALGPTLTQPGGLGELSLMANAREKLNLGGLDSRSTKLGADVLQSSLDELQLLYHGEEAGVLDMFSQLRFDTREVQDCWWSEGAAEPKKLLEERMREFMCQLLYSRHRCVVVVGHSHFFRSVFRDYMCEMFSAQNPGLVRELTSKKIMNCGVARVELDPSRGVSGGPIIGVELVLGTTMDADGISGVLACCNAAQSRGRDGDGGPRPGEELVDPAKPPRYEPAGAPEADGVGPLRSPFPNEARA
mmetsp:Transcript_9759/g.28868  ORF Transcript_9759/g.28868 Transcript_9759/m.28868 type:complete len:517 (+) Transcript_9759:55-1605(+)